MIDSEVEPSWQRGRARSRSRPARDPVLRSRTGLRWCSAPTKADKAMAKRVLYVSGSVGLGHVTRDLAIVRELRALQPDLEVTWLAQSPATDVLEAAGEPLLPE